MFTAIATILSIQFLIEHLTEILIAAAVLVVLIIIWIRNNQKKRAAYLALPVLFIGNKMTRTYHSPTCRMLHGANRANLVAFRTPEEPVRAGYKRCEICRQ